MSERTFANIGGGILSAVVRLLGFLLLLIGLWIAFQVLLTAEDLYRNPTNIERFVAAVEQGSNIDKTLSSFHSDDTANGIKPDAQEKNPIRVSYFFAWMIVLLLLLLIGRISLAAIKTGGELVLFNMKVRD